MSLMLYSMRSNFPVEMGIEYSLPGGPDTLEIFTSSVSLFFWGITPRHCVGSKASHH